MYEHREIQDEVQTAENLKAQKCKSLIQHASDVASVCFAVSPLLWPTYKYFTNYYKHCSKQPDFTSRSEGLQNI